MGVYFLYGTGVSIMGEQGQRFSFIGKFSGSERRWRIGHSQASGKVCRMVCEGSGLGWGSFCWSFGQDGAFRSHILALTTTTP